MQASAFAFVSSLVFGYSARADIHSYTMNLAQATRMVLEELELLPDVESPLESSSLATVLGLNRRDENVRPIFWRNRNRSYVARTQDGTSFLTVVGRFSFALLFGELDSYGVGLKGTTSRTSSSGHTYLGPGHFGRCSYDTCKDKSSRCLGVSSPLRRGQSNPERLDNLNRRGFLTINSQPAVNGCQVVGSTFGWALAMLRLPKVVPRSPGFAREHLRDYHAY